MQLVTPRLSFARDTDVVVTAMDILSLCILTRATGSTGTTRFMSGLVTDSHMVSLWATIVAVRFFFLLVPSCPRFLVLLI